MKSSECLRWCWRHSVTLEFKRTGDLFISFKKKDKLIIEKLVLRNHDTVAEDICRHIDKLSTKYNIE